MDQTWEIIGIVFAVLMVIIGLRLLLKKPEPSPIVKMDELPIDEDSQQPIVPRAVREQLSASPVSISNDPVTSPAQSLTESKNQDAPIEAASEIKIEESKKEHTEALTKETLDLDALQKELDEEDDLVLEAQQRIKQEDQKAFATDDTSEDLSEREILPLDFKDDDLLSEATVLDMHLSQQNRVDEESALATAQKIVALYMYPNPERALSGERTLKMLLKYGLRFGEMSCFHRYEHPEHPSSLMFSVLRIDDDGAPTGFDLEALPTDEVKGLAFFLALPSPTAVQGFDMMSSIAGLIARDTDGLVFDEQSLELTPQLRDHWRHYVIEYDPEQAKHLD